MIVNQGAVELSDTITDPLLNAWHDNAGREVTDACRNYFASSSTTAEGGESLGGSSTANEKTGAGTLSTQTYGGHGYYVNSVYNKSSGSPDHLAGVRGERRQPPHFTAPNPVNAGEIVGFDGMECEIRLQAGTSYSAGVGSTTYSTYTWDFGDGTPDRDRLRPRRAAMCEAPWLSPCAGSTFHTYQYGGNYTVTLTVTDVGGNERDDERADDRRRPAPAGAAGGGRGSGSGSGSGSDGTGSTTATGSTTSTGSGSGGGAGAAIANPVANAAVVVAHAALAEEAGVVVGYSVNEQVAGHVEVLLGARRSPSGSAQGRRRRGPAPPARRRRS